MGLLDKIMLLGSRAHDEKVLSSTLSVFESDKEEHPLILKFYYPGNVQYHKVSEGEIRLLHKELGKFLNDGHAK
ncbi:MAG: hypothetical protein JKY00_04090 [Roseicyclus sp.]|nr:hypothetical protein [Roseicyclus sp.]